MTSLLLRARLWLAALLFAPTLLLAAPYEVIGAISTHQTGGPFLTNLGNGTTRWVTPLDWTNNNAFATGPLFFIATSQWVNGSPVNANAMQWDNAAGLFRQGNLAAEADNEDRFIKLTDTDISFAALNPVFGIGAGDSLAAFALGTFNPGQTRNAEINFLLTDSIGEMWFNGFIVQQKLPLPGSLPLVLAGFLALSAARRIRR
ncbi:hypothetical protein J2X20_001730 [Pelomonas saccharophila]|uniref:PEP-CTERM protein-sorting domain-containing protein n=1 Tax=Roseateles saccharophilus TaxID=304 RepID=A0ABU1YJR8_ROSSA|nr:hypothetical protein [Roseateles saccharophilus]MDR7269101.1 hypothetical protein [Roseateles saccharophilus]